MKRFELYQLVREELRRSADVESLNKARQKSPNVLSKSKEINSRQEFPGAFKDWFVSLDLQPNKISKMYIKNEIDKILTTLGYK